LIIQYEDGTTDTIPAAEILTNEGSLNQELVNNEKNIVKILSKLSTIEDAAEAADELTPPTNEIITVDVEDVNVEVDGTIKEYWDDGAYPDPRENNNPKIIIGDKEFTLTKAVTDPTFLTDAQIIVRNYMEAKRYHLLEFAASMAALEIQMASYLDDEDFEDYKNN